MEHLVDCTVPEKILLAASHLEDGGQTPFSAEALIVSAWQRYPRTFGLKGFEEQYPDSNKVLSGIMGERGLPKRGWMAQVGQKLYSLTRDGRQVVRKLIHGEDTPPLTAKRVASKLSREQESLLVGLFAGPAFAKWAQGKQLEWTFSEACRFWSMGDRLGAAVDARLDELQRDLTEVEKLLAGGSQTLPGGKNIGATDVGALLDVHQQLEQRFGRHLTLLRSRSERA